MSSSASASFTLRARLALPIEGRPISNALVVCCDGRIVEVGAREARGELIDFGDVLLLPALVNAHTHLEFSNLAAPLGRSGMSLPDWLRAAVAERASTDEPGAATALGAIASGAAEATRFGTGVVGEIAQTTAAPTQIPQPLQGVAYWEARGLDRSRGDELAAITESYLREEGGRWRRGLSPHAPYSLHLETLERLVAIAAAAGAPVAMHVAESREELEFLATGGGPFRELLDAFGVRCEPGATARRILDYLERLAPARRTAVVHGNYLGAEELDFLAQHQERFAVVYCPRTHAYFRHERHPAADLMRRGVRVALGTDSRASSPDLNLLAELRTAAAAAPDVDPGAWLRAATLDAAWALGLEAEFGALTAGRRAVFTVLPFERGDPHEAVLAGSSVGRLETCELFWPERRGRGDAV